jgi:hypothetical protein
MPDEDPARVKGYRPRRAQELADRGLEAKRKAEANRGVTGGQRHDSTRNPSGTYSEPTPTDIRYPNKDATEFENNHGAFVGRSAAQMREEAGMEDKPGGLIPEVHEAVKEAEVAAASAADVATNAEAKAAEGQQSGDLDSMTVPQLKQHAADNGIDLDGATTKADIRAAIDAAKA